MMDERDPLNLIVCGTGGQGNVLLSRFLARAFIKKGYSTTIGETFGQSQRGGAVMSHVRVSKKKSYGPLIPEGQGHVILGLEPMETIRVLGNYGNPNVAVVSNVRPIYPMAAITGEKDYPDMKKNREAIRALSATCWLLDATEISLELGNPILTNMVMIGALIRAGLVDLHKYDAEDVVRETFPPKATGINLKAINRGIDAAERVG